MAKDYSKIAGKKVQGALTVFDKASTEVEKAQALLEEGIKKDAEKIQQIDARIEELRIDRLTFENDMQDKREHMMANKELLNSLSKFKA